jgi:hypothetical protein
MVTLAPLGASAVSPRCVATHATKTPSANSATPTGTAKNTAWRNIISRFIKTIGVPLRYFTRLLKDFDFPSASTRTFNSSPGWKGLLSRFARIVSL